MLACLLGLQSQHFAAFEGGRSQSGLPVSFVWVKEQVGAEILLSCCETHPPRGNGAFLLKDKGTRPPNELGPKWGTFSDSPDTLCRLGVGLPLRR